MNDVWMLALEDIAEGKPLSPELQKALRDENNKLVGLAAKIMGKIPTNSPINGEFTHPIVLTNLMASVLEQRGMPLSEEQRLDFESLGTQYEAEYKALQTDYHEGTPLLRKIVDELALKHDAMNLVEESLSEEQRNSLVPAELKNRMQMDVLSPFTMAVMLARAKSYGSPEKYRAAVGRDLTNDYKLDENQIAALDPTLEQHFRDIASLLSRAVVCGEMSRPIR